MIHVSPKPEPASFHNSVRIPGERSIAEMVGKTPPYPRTKGRAFTQRSRKCVDGDGNVAKERNGNPKKVLVTTEADLPSEEFCSYWTEALSDLMNAYNEVCAYSCFRIHPVTGGRSVDHMAPKSRAWNQVYEWNNYRLCSSLLNARKSNFGDVLDPFEVEDGWFVLEMVGYQVLPAPHLSSSPATQHQVWATIDRLRLNGPDFITSRERDVYNYNEHGVPFNVLMEESPFVAKELARQGLLREEDAQKMSDQTP